MQMQPLWRRRPCFNNPRILIGLHRPSKERDSQNGHAIADLTIPSCKRVSHCCSYKEFRSFDLISVSSLTSEENHSTQFPLRRQFLTQTSRNTAHHVEHIQCLHAVTGKYQEKTYRYACHSCQSLQINTRTNRAHRTSQQTWRLSRRCDLGIR